MKKIIIAGLLLIALVLTGCNGGNETPADTTTAASTTTPAPETTTVAPETTAAPETTTAAPETTTAPETTAAPADTTTAETTAAQIANPDLMDVAYVGGSISGALGTDINHAGRFKTADYLTLAEIEAVSITGEYFITWFAYDANYTYLGNGSNTYPTLPTAGVWLEKGQDVTAAEILAWNADTVYLRFAVKRTSGNIFLETDVELSEIKVYVANYPGDDYVPSVS